MSSEAAHVDIFSYVLLELSMLVLFALLGRWVAARIKQPPVLGELGMGLLLGNIGYWLGVPVFVLIMHLGEVGQVFSQALEANVAIGQLAGELAQKGEIHAVVAELLNGADAKRMILMGVGASMFSSLGVILLMFMVGLGTSVAEMKAVGGRATLVALVGVFASLAAGFLGARFLLPEASQGVHLFLGVILCSTSVGISARVFESLGRDQERDAKIVFGASVIDDIASIVVLAVVVGIATTGKIEMLAVGKTLGLALLFLGSVVLLGESVVGRIVMRLEVLEQKNARLLIPLVLLFLFAWFASLLQLATITGAFAAGLVTGDKLFGQESEFTIEHLMHPLEALFAPVFFVLMGMQVNLATLLDPTILGVALVMTLAAVVGKAAAGASAGAESDRLTVGLGMIPRGEEALLFASIGIGLGVLSSGLFSAVVLMVMLTALLAPIGLKWSLVRAAKS